ncbi:MAG: GNAT family N-acetyltransferase [Chloroflexi bacterium]|nr:GNAT family N-acetyltransferase [Chloroflexota bacterium]
MPVNLTLRPFKREDDYTPLAHILTASENADSKSITVSAAELAENLSKFPRFDLARDLVIAETDGQPVGFGRIRWEDSPSRRTYGLTGYLLREWRRKGIGQKLLNWLEERARAIVEEQPTTVRVTCTSMPPCTRKGCTRWYDRPGTRSRKAGR